MRLTFTSPRVQQRNERMQVCDEGHEREINSCFPFSISGLLLTSYSVKQTSYSVKPTNVLFGQTNVLFGQTSMRVLDVLFGQNKQSNKQNKLKQAL